MNYDTYFPYGLMHQDRRCRLYCFHHAGGSAFVFKNWLDFSELVETVPMEVPDREKPPETLHFEAVIADAANAIAQTADQRPIFIYGHSLGALFAFQTAWQLEQQYQIEVQKLFVAGRHAPPEESNSDFKCAHGEAALLQELKKEGGTPEHVLEDEVFRSHFLPRIWHDYRLNEEYVYRGERLDVPIVALSGTEDIDATRWMMKKWKNVTTAAFVQYAFSGNHFFPYGESEAAVLQTLQCEIQKTLFERNTEDAE